MVHGQNLCDLVRLSYVRTVHISVPLGPKNLSLLFIGTHQLYFGDVTLTVTLLLILSMSHYSTCSELRGMRELRR